MIYICSTKIKIENFVAAIIQSLKTEPEMVNLIYNIFPTVNDRKQHKDNLITIKFSFSL
jgi:hypothetical protein